MLDFPETSLHPSERHVLHEEARSPPPNPPPASTSRNWLQLGRIALKMSKNNTENHLKGSGQCPPWHSSVGSGPRRTSSTDMLRVPQQGVHALWYLSDGQADQSTHQRQTHHPLLEKPACCLQELLVADMGRERGGDAAQPVLSITLGCTPYAPNACPDLALLTPPFPRFCAC